MHITIGFAVLFLCGCPWDDRPAYRITVTCPDIAWTKRDSVTVEGVRADLGQVPDSCVRVELR